VGYHARLNEVTEVLQLDRQADVVDHHVLGNRKNVGRNVQDAHDARIDQGIGHFLGRLGGHGEDGHPDVVPLGERCQLAHGQIDSR
jgi:hypothetical protein